MKSMRKTAVFPCFFLLVLAGGIAAKVTSVLSTIAVFVPVIFIIVLAHEFGHYIAAVLSGVRVKEFSIGFGPRVLGKERNGTEYNLRPIPIGGYVELAGTDPKLSEEESDIPDDQKFYHKSVFKRFMILFSGPLFNFLLALGVFACIYIFIGVPTPKFTLKPTVGQVLPGKPASEIKLKSGDLITSVNGQKVETWTAMADMIRKHPLKPLKLGYMRGNEKKKTILVAEKNEKGEGKIGISCGIEPVIGVLIPNKPAQKAGIAIGDRIVSINDEPIYNWERAVEIINNNVDNSLKVIVERPAKENKNSIEKVTCVVTPEYNAEMDAGIIGINFETEYSLETNVFDAVVLAWNNTASMTVMMVKGIVKLVSGKIFMKNVAGPVGIAGVVKSRADRGVAALFHVIAVLSINIGLLNLFPFPALDGGRLIFIFLEVLIRRKVSIKIEEMVHQAGLVVLIFLIILVTYRDIINWIQ